MVDDVVFCRSEHGKNDAVYLLSDTNGNGKFDLVVRQQRNVFDEKKGYQTYGENREALQLFKLYEEGGSPIKNVPETFKLIDKKGEIKTVTLNKETAPKFFAKLFDNYTVLDPTKDADNKKLEDFQKEKKERIVLDWEPVTIKNFKTDQLVKLEDAKEKGCKKKK
ncbi:MAG: hypothetical protein V4691_08705 [Pseudomonadota bacterium]